MQIKLVRNLVIKLIPKQLADKGRELVEAIDGGVALAREQALTIKKANDIAERLGNEEAAWCEAGCTLAQHDTILAYSKIYIEFARRCRTNWPDAALWFVKHTEGKTLADFAPSAS